MDQRTDCGRDELHITQSMWRCGGSDNEEVQTSALAQSQNTKQG